MFSGSFKILQYQAIYGIAQESASYVFYCTVILLVAAIVSVFQMSESDSKIPLYKDEGLGSESAKKKWTFDAITILRKGNTKYGDKPFRVMTTEGDVVMLPPKLLNEVKMLPDSILPSWLLKVLQADHTGLGGPTKPMFLTNLIKHDLNKNMARMFPGVMEEVKHALPAEFPTIPDWTALKLHTKVVRVVCRVSGRAFVGTKLNRNEQWIQMNCDYAKNVFGAAAALRMYPQPLRYIVRYFTSALKVVRAQHTMAENILTPIIKERNQGEKCEGYEKPKDTIEWVRDAMPLNEKDDYHFQSLCQLGITAAAIHTTSQTVTFALYDLASYPEYVPMLREEAVKVRNQCGGEFTLESMGELKKLDSFIKESQRMNPIIITTVVRKILKPLTLSDGTYLPRNTITMAATEALSGDPTYYKEPEKFDGLRFYNLRQRSAEDEKRSQFVSTSQTHLHFGSGRHACPGRWFASHEMKLIIIAFIERYDLKLKYPEGRPKNMRYQHINAPDPNGEILLKSHEL